MLKVVNEWRESYGIHCHGQHLIHIACAYQSRSGCCSHSITKISGCKFEEGTIATGVSRLLQEVSIYSVEKNWMGLGDMCAWYSDS